MRPYFSTTRSMASSRAQGIQTPWKFSLSVAAEAVTAVPEDEASAILRAVVTLDGWRCELCGTQRSFFAGSVEEKEEALALVRNKEEGRDLAPYIPHLR